MLPQIMLTNVVDRDARVNVLSSAMFTEKMARLTSDFTSRILETLREASLAELSARGKAPPSRATKKAATARIAQRITKRRSQKVRARDERPAPDVTTAALVFFAERGNKGATAHQLSVHLEALGIDTDADVIEALAKDGSIRDAGFRRSTGTGNKTATVYVSAS